MGATITRNSMDPDRPVTPPVREDGTLYPFAMLFNGYKDVAFADSLTDMAAVLLGFDYYEKSDEEKAAAREEYLNSVQVWVQAQINSESPDIDSVSTEEYEILMGSRDTQPDIIQWNSKVPLVLLTTGYAPYTAITVPEVGEGSEIIWFDPTNEDAMLRSLHMVGEIELAVSAQADTADAD